jgi:hypothetical protein
MLSSYLHIDLPSIFSIPAIKLKFVCIFHLPSRNLILHDGLPHLAFGEEYNLWNSSSRIFSNPKLLSLS